MASHNISMTAKQYPGAGKCLICLDDHKNLTREHIVPLGLSSDGEVYINNGTCSECNDRMNKAFENAAMQSDFLEVRAVLGLKRRKRKQSRKLRLPPIEVLDNFTGIWHRLDMPAEKRPGAVSFVELPPAGQLVGLNRDPGMVGVTVNFRTLYPERAYRNMGFRLPFVEGAGPRLMTKAGYLYGVAELGLDSFDGRDIRAVLMGERNDIYNFVGGLSEHEELTTAGELHHFYIRRRGGLMTVIVHLFASIGAPAYEVVLGPAK